ncbi:hypothetical protein BN128_3856 [Cronobacter sakazakii 696]|nr:hypothetical protein BN128_3856 [Cronobacter sakazakii 696]
MRFSDCYRAINSEDALQRSAPDGSDGHFPVAWRSQKPAFL